MRRIMQMLGWLLLGCLVATSSQAGSQIEEPLSHAVKAMMQRSISDKAPLKLSFPSSKEGEVWLNTMSARLKKHVPNATYREDLLRTVHYEASRAGLDPQLVLGLIQAESGFNKYAVSAAGARGFMQIMPFWPRVIGAPEHNLFLLRTNLRYGCTILRHYLDLEHGDLFRALGRYNGSLGQAAYPNLVLATWRKHWAYP